VITFIDELHTLVGAGAAEGSMDAGNMVKPLLARGELRLIGATTLDEYRKYIEKDSALERRSSRCLSASPRGGHHCHPPRPEGALRIPSPGAIQDAALVAAACVGSLHPGRFLPDKAIDLIDEAAVGCGSRSIRCPPSSTSSTRRIRQLEIERVALARSKTRLPLNGWPISRPSWRSSARGQFDDGALEAEKAASSDRRSER